MINEKLKRQAHLAEASRARDSKFAKVNGNSGTILKFIAAPPLQERAAIFEHFEK